MKKNITDNTIKALKPEAKPHEIMDTQVPSFGVRVMPSGVKSFILFRRFPGSDNPVRRSLGAYPAITLAQAREKARTWLDMIGKGIDPAQDAKRLKVAAIAAQRQKEANTFGAAFQDYLKRKAKLRSIRVIELELRRECRDWMDRPLADISQRDVKELIGGIAGRGHETSAHAIFAMVRGVFNWIVDSGDYGIEGSPCAKIKPTVLIGPRNIGSRTLKDHELAAFWRAAGAMDYPFGPFFKLLLLTALRRNEAADAQWSEIDLEDRLWVVPPGRMKSGAAHAVPLTDEIFALLDGLPRWNAGDFVFSSTGGERPISGFSKAKAKLDAAMLADLEARGLQFEKFVVHDVRRTVRTKLSALPIEQHVRELLLAHAQPGLHKVYDLHAYQEEKAHALTLWHARLRVIVEPKPDNVVPMRAAG